MRFDDRLQTLIDAPVADAREVAIRWRQLVDLLSRAERLDTQGSVGSALAIVARDAEQVDAEVRAAALRSISGRPISAALLKVLASQPLAIAAPLFAGRSLSAEEADDVLAEADPALRGLVRIDRAGEQGASEAPMPPPGPPSISAVVDRMEQRRRQRSHPLPGHAARATGGGRLFEWESDSTGHIAWVEGVPRGALVGRSLGGDGLALLNPQAAARVVQRHPFEDAPLAPAQTFEGEWRATGVPAFDPTTGRFLGYRGIARRTDPAPDALDAEPENRERDADSLRELVHEIKTPLNAIIGFAEIIDGQYLGPAHARYRDRAAQIVGQARKLLEAVEDLDFAAALRAGRHENGSGSRLADLFPKLSDEIAHLLTPRGARIEVDIDDERHRCALSPMLAERLARRMLIAVSEHVAEGETCRVAVSSAASMALLMIARPRALDGVDESMLVDPAFDPAPGEAPSGIGLGFALRLVRGLARVAGGDLRIDPHRLTLVLPLATLALDA